ncbi:DUF1775 domain-containing protein [Xanthobacter autotrophicus]|uniref:DUF1775 domain-containing protein n=1 Tax=Xanthobacter TaxID=279 RepID=UPI0024AB43D1|nr:DUF1775 domain-containing protein [Xanthobacter autotrophicus]MDI4665848.1 DUF1775 domain-containing protein [Xanthobacter autotrophicus]
MTRILLSGAALAVALFTSSAQAHVTLEKADATAGTFYKAVLKVGHGCEGSPTTQIKVTVPNGFVAAKPMPKPGWTVETASGPYDRAYAFHGKPVAEGVTAITWSGGSLPDGQYDEFVFVAFLAPEAGARAAPVPVVQTCVKGEHRWVEVAQGGAKLAAPAPVLKIAAAGAAAPAAGTVEAGDLVIDAPWSRATPGGAKVAGGFLRITNTGTTPDRLLGGTFSRSGSVQVHEMAVNNGVMTMRELADGLEIAPGQTVELAPGGYHLMFMDLREPLKEGETVTGTLRFKTAGTVDVSFVVRGIGAKAGAPAPAAGGHQH